MARTILSPQRRSEMIPLNIGHVILFCEGPTEKHYFDYFAEFLNNKKYNDLRVVTESAAGNAQRVLSFAQEYMANEDNQLKYGGYDQYLVFDCDAPPTIQKVIQDAKDYELLVSNHLFETWLLMHFEDLEPSSKLGKKKTFERLSGHLSSTYEKANKGIIRKIIQNGSIERAIDNAKALEHEYKEVNYTIHSDIKKMNPFSSVYRFVESLLFEVSTIEPKEE